MGFCNEDPEMFGIHVTEFLSGVKKREENTKKNAEVFLEKYGMKYCPFHSYSLVEKVRPDKFELKIEDDLYFLHEAVCSKVRICTTPISFDSKLIERVSASIINELEFVDKKWSGCTTCGETRGELYLVGFRTFLKDPKLKRVPEYSNDMPIVLAKNSCGHNYVMGQSICLNRLKKK